MDFAVEVDQLRKVYPSSSGQKPALDGLSFKIPNGRVYGLIGRNGAGKTTFVRIASTQLALTSGSVSVLGMDVVSRTRDVRARIACVPQESRPLYFLNTEEVVYLYLKMRGMDPVEAKRRTRDALEELSLTEYRKRLVSRLSGGLRRRALCAMVLASDAEVLFLDEPTTGLDPLARREVWKAVRRTIREHRTIVLTTHYLDEAEALSTRLALIEQGQLRLEGSPEDPFPREELESYGRVTKVEGGYLVFAREADAREVARKGLERGVRVSLGPVSLEDIFLEVVGKSIEEDAPAEDGEEALA
jgi:ABC-2 type transport system ATP-binding protein